MKDGEQGEERGEGQDESLFSASLSQSAPRQDRSEKTPPVESSSHLTRALLPSEAHDLECSGILEPDSISGPVVPGQVLFNKYRVIRSLGRGGMGEVWLVEHLELECKRALKLIDPKFASDPEMRMRFRREAKALACFVHTNIVTVHDAKLTANAAFIEMEYIKGKSLNKIHRPGELQTLDWTSRILAQICSALQMAHDYLIVHRDLKPSNLMLLDGRPPGREHVKVLDFGIAKILDPKSYDSDDFQTRSGSFLGTIAYASPEQAIQGPIDHRSDLYSLGVILYELLTGRCPFTGPCALHNHVYQPPPPFAEVNPDVRVPPEVEAVVLRCLAKCPTARPPSARVLSQDFLNAARSSCRKSVAFPFTDEDPSWDPPSDDKTSRRGGSPADAGATNGHLPEDFENMSGTTSAPMTKEALPTGRPPEAAAGGTLPPTGARDEPRHDAPGGSLDTTPCPGHRGRRGLREMLKKPLVLGLLAALVVASLGGFFILPSGPDSSGDTARRGISTSEGARAGKREEGKATAAGLSELGPRETAETEPVPGASDVSPARAPSSLKETEPTRPVEVGLPPELTLKSADIKLILIPAGTFLMGSPEGEGSSNEHPQRAVKITRPFYLGRTEVTQGQYERIMGENPSWFSKMGPGWDILRVPNADAYPVERVSYADALAYCRRLGRGENLPEGSVRLPTEAEWEYAARANRDPEPGASAALMPRAWFQENAEGHTHPVAEKRPNAFHLFDMAGNVWEWCSDWYVDHYTDAPQTDPAGPDQSPDTVMRVLRGGGWIGDAQQCRPTDRNAAAPDERLNCYGFRVVLDAEAGRRLAASGR
jgi:eukaryotic-like serine/threonine-protein kinase